MLPLVYAWNIYALLFWFVYVIWFALEIMGSRAQRAEAGAKRQDRGSMAILLCCFVGHLYRVRVEEQALCTSLGQPYVQ
jgi:uncharacterized membrane protein